VRATRKAVNVSRVIDIILAVVALVVLAPLLAIIALAVKLQDGGPALFWQNRIGRGGHRFPCFKFRSMVINAEGRLAQYLADHPEARAEWDADHKLRNDPRITSLGRFLRKSSLDELPQLLNVLRGEMSLVGPRPIVDAEITRYGRYFEHYCRVRPGITGLWQVMGRNDVSYRRRVALDVTYVKVCSTGTYVAVLAKTVPAVLNRTGVY
jgi:exopolysaccharide production protein ExoY